MFETWSRQARNIQEEMTQRVWVCSAKARASPAKAKAKAKGSKGQQAQQDKKKDKAKNKDSIGCWTRSLLEGLLEQERTDQQRWFKGKEQEQEHNRCSQSRHDKASKQ